MGLAACWVLAWVGLAGWAGRPAVAGGRVVCWASYWAGGWRVAGCELFVGVTTPTQPTSKPPTQAGSPAPGPPAQAASPDRQPSPPVQTPRPSHQSSPLAQPPVKPSSSALQPPAFSSLAAYYGKVNIYNICLYKFIYIYIYLYIFIYIHIYLYIFIFINIYLRERPTTGKGTFLGLGRGAFAGRVVFLGVAK